MHKAQDRSTRKNVVARVLLIHFIFWRVNLVNEVYQSSSVLMSTIFTSLIHLVNRPLSRSKVKKRKVTLDSF